MDLPIPITATEVKIALTLTTKNANESYAKNTNNQNDKKQKTVYLPTKLSTTTKFPAFPKVTWQQTPETCTNHHKLNIIHIDFAIKTSQETQRLKKSECLT